MQLLDYLIIAIHFIASVSIGIAFRGKQRDINDYFTSSGGFGGIFGTILIGFSIAATLFSGISFLAYPSVIYTSGLRVFPVVISLIPSYFVLRYWFLPRYLSHGNRQPYEHIDRQYGKNVRYVTSILYILYRVGWMGALIYVPTLMIIAAMQLSEGWFWPLVLVIGLSSTLYTVIGGIRGVIVTDALQFVIILFGIFFCLIYIVFNIDIPAGRVFADLKADGALTLFDFSFDLSQTFTVWTIGIGLTITNLAIYTGDQMSLQRYLASSTPKSATQSFGTNILGATLVLILLFLVGLSMSAWYRYHPDPNLPVVADKVFPYFAATQLPSGTAGLLIAAILAATMSSMTSGINALAGSITSDFYAPTHQNKTKTEMLRFARWTSLGIGVAATLVSGFIQHLGSIWDITQTLGGTLLGPVFVIVLIATLRWKVRPGALMLSLPLAFVIGILISRTDVSTLWIIPCTITTTVAVPWLDRILFSKPHKIETTQSDSNEL